MTHSTTEGHEEVLNRLKQGAKHLAGSEERSCNPSEAPTPDWDGLGVVAYFCRKHNLTGNQFAELDGLVRTTIAEAVEKAVMYATDGEKKIAAQQVTEAVEKERKSWQDFLRDKGTTLTGFGFSDHQYSDFLDTLTNPPKV